MRLGASHGSNISRQASHDESSPHRWNRNMTQQLADIGLVGLAVMGENLALNMESKGFRVAVYNRTTARVDEFVAGRARGKNFIGARTTQELVAALKAPRKILMLIKAGPAVDAVIDELLPLLDR